ncbi:hypothetical protein UFOVP245_174 [uncultured Caudovirales phage]|uniref:Uncharacterized protein n=1 Tax=uncultured Caudovirales phage TaxID=2100421 RepID=A0A6J7X2K4_9CAUD|nr:hypothetical protein UFOVP245_174 [uncultured Caudovirales phage]
MDEKKILEQFAKSLGIESKLESLDTIVEEKKKQIEANKPKLKPMSEMYAIKPHVRTKRLIERKELPVQTEVKTNNTKIVIEHKVKQ